MSEKNSKVAICEQCGGFIQAHWLKYPIDKATERSFARLSNEGFTIKVETSEETRARRWVTYEDAENCKKGLCKPNQLSKDLVMKNEELKVALCGYLPHGVKFQVIEKGSFSNSPDSVRYVCADFNNAEHLMREKSYSRKSSKIVLYNISTLTKPIIVKGYNGGEEFVPIEKIDRIIPDKCFINKFNFKIEFNNGYKEFFTFDEMEIILNLLNRWKIDYRNLIGQGLAIDVETLDVNPYK